MAGPQKQTFTDVQPIADSPQQQTFTNVQPIDSAQPSVWDVLTQPTEKTDAEYGTYRGPAGVAGATIKGLDDVGRGVEGALSGTWNAVRHPIDTAKGIAELPSEAAQVPGAVKDINASPDPLGTYANVAQDTASQGAGQALVALGTEGLGRTVAEAKPYVGPVSKALVKGYAKKVIPPEVGEAVKAVKATNEIKRGAIADAFKDPGAPEPVTPPKEVLQGNSLHRGPKPIEDPAAGLGSIPVKRGAVAEQMQSTQPVQRGSLRKMVDNIGDKVGEELKASPPPDPKKPIFQRGSLSNAMQEGTQDMPQGHTPHQSSALRSSMYDSGAKEFHARMTSGDTTYVYGDVAPEEAQAFTDAESKGKAYQQMKSGHPLVAKIVGGKRIAVKPSGSGAIAPPAGK